MLRALANSAIHPSEVGKWVVIHVIRYMVTGWRPSVVDWGVVCLLAANCESIVRYAGYGRRYLCRGTAAIADQPSLPRLYWYRLVLRFVVVKWRYIKYLALPFLPFSCRTRLENGNKWLNKMLLDAVANDRALRNQFVARHKNTYVRHVCRLVVYCR